MLSKGAAGYLSTSLCFTTTLIRREAYHGSSWIYPWWRHKMETFSALLALCEGNLPVTSGSPYKGQFRGALMCFFNLRWNKQLSRRSRHRRFLTPSRSLRCHCNARAITKNKSTNEYIKLYKWIGGGNDNKWRLRVHIHDVFIWICLLCREYVYSGSLSPTVKSLI